MIILELQVIIITKKNYFFLYKLCFLLIVVAYNLNWFFPPSLYDVEIYWTKFNLFNGVPILCKYNSVIFQ